MTQDEAKQIIIDRVQKEAFHDAAASVRDIEARAKEEAEKKAREYAWQYGKKHGKGWKRSKKAVDGAACEMQLMYVEQTRQADYRIWFYQAGNEEDGIAVEMTPQGELIAADEGFG